MLGEDGALEAHGRGWSSGPSEGMGDLEVPDHSIPTKFFQIKGSCHYNHRCCVMMNITVSICIINRIAQ